MLEISLLMKKNLTKSGLSINYTINQVHFWHFLWSILRMVEATLSVAYSFKNFKAHNKCLGLAQSGSKSPIASQKIEQRNGKILNSPRNLLRGKDFRFANEFVRNRNASYANWCGRIHIVRSMNGSNWKASLSCTSLTCSLNIITFDFGKINCVKQGFFEQRR